MLLGLLLVPGIAHAEPGWVTLAGDALRWPDAKVVSTPLAIGDEVEVVLRDGDQVRVRKGTDFGWFPAASLSATAPVAPTPPADAEEAPVVTP